MKEITSKCDLESRCSINHLGGQWRFVQTRSDTFFLLFYTCRVCPLTNMEQSKKYVLTGLQKELDPNTEGGWRSQYQLQVRHSRRPVQTLEEQRRQEREAKTKGQRKWATDKGSLGNICLDYVRYALLENSSNSQGSGREFIKKIHIVGCLMNLGICEAHVREERKNMK